MAFSLLFFDFLVFTITFPSSSRGLIIAPVTGSRGIGFRPGFFFSPVDGAFSLLDEFVVDVWGNKLDAEFKMFVTFSNGRVCVACGLETWLARSKANCLFYIETCFMSACWSNCCCIGFVGVEAISNPIKYLIHKLHQHYHWKT